MSAADLQENLRVALVALPLVLLAFALHEMAHAYVATFFGDPTPARHGRRTLNPIRHLDPLGTAMLVGSMVLLGFPFGFAVTPVDDERMRRPRLHGALTLLAGPAVNVLLCAASLVLLLFAPAGSLLQEAAYYSTLFNAFLAVFNMLPIPPLDGGRVVGSLMGDELRREWRKLDQYGIFIVLGLILLGGASFSAFIVGLRDLLLQLVGGFVQVSLAGPG